MQNNYFCIYPCIDIYERPSINSKISSQIIYGEKDELVSKNSIDDLRNRLKNQKGIEVNFSEIKNANHFFTGKEDDLKKSMHLYIKKNTELI